MHRSQRLEMFDVVLLLLLSSSLEHAGLGLYGDALSPWGDVLAAAQARCRTKPGGYFGLAVPCNVDMIHFNAHRWYGRNPIPLMGANWIQHMFRSHTRHKLGKDHSAFSHQKTANTKPFGVAIDGE